MTTEVQDIKYGVVYSNGVWPVAVPCEAQYVSDGRYTFEDLYDHMHNIYHAISKLGSNRWRSKYTITGNSNLSRFYVGTTIPSRSGTSEVVLCVGSYTKLQAKWDLYSDVPVLDKSPSRPSTYREALEHLYGWPLPTLRGGTCNYLYTPGGTLEVDCDNGVVSPGIGYPDFNALYSINYSLLIVLLGEELMVRDRDSYSTLLSTL